MSINTPLSNPSTSIWNQLNWHPSSKQLQQFTNLQSLLQEWNRQVNLTRLLEKNDYWIGQVFDSLWPLKNELDKPTTSLSCVDVGTGCGFPGLAVAIALPKAKITLIDSISRKTKILSSISKELALSDRIIICNERVEVAAHKVGFRKSFDLAMARAVAEAPVVAEYLIPLLKNKGEALLYRGKWNKSNQHKLHIALEVLNAKIKTIQRIELPEARGERHLIRIISTKDCPNKYPRSIGIPLKKPLGI